MWRKRGGLILTLSPDMRVRCEQLGNSNPSHIIIRHRILTLMNIATPAAQSSVPKLASGPTKSINASSPRYGVEGCYVDEPAPRLGSCE